MSAIALIRRYIRFKRTAEQFIGHPWEDEELKKIVKEQISKLHIEKLLNEVVDTGFITCGGCGKTIRPDVDMCLSCRWENPLASLNVLG